MVKDVFSEQQRLIMLQTMAEDEDYSINNEMFQPVLKNFGHAISIDLINSHFNYLEEIGLITTSLCGKFIVATLTRRGLDVAQGVAKAPGVARAKPF